MDIRYKGYIIEENKNRGDYRVYDPLSPSQTIAYEDSVESAKKGIDEQCTAKNEISFDNGYGETYRFTVVDKIPSSQYRVWNIGDNMVDGYLPLCLRAPSEHEWQEQVALESLVAIDMKDRPDVLKDLRKAAGIGIDNLESVYKALGIVATNQIAREQKEWAQVLLPVYEELSSGFIGYLRGR